MASESDLDQVAVWLEAARRVLFITGAGIWDLRRHDLDIVWTG
jgi:hypothetical protein